ncbi:CAP domain-containing protein [Bacillus sp. REN10]|uniref:CAP domain-containing protein n=1 Tax=Bacillus sp. REN10 TaxID=2782541 RepID=UPI00193AFFBB|nr:CAP domain-containing protein [Bacillus sp. REN10]
MKKVVLSMLLAFTIAFPSLSHAQSGYQSYTVQPGDSMWKIAVKFQIGLQEIINANPEIKTPSMIYPKQVLKIPLLTDVKNFEQEVIRLTNVERQKNGLAPLATDWQLSRVARYKSTDMANKNYFSHTSPTYGSPFQMMKAFGISYRAAGENIAAGQQTPQAVVNAWMNSSGHRANILSSSFTHIGVGYYKGGSQGVYWTQMFISK